MKIVRIFIFMLFTCFWVSNLNADAIDTDTGAYCVGVGGGDAINTDTGAYCVGVGGDQEIGADNDADDLWDDDSWND